MADDQPYTLDLNTLVMNHPLFLMAVHNRYKLMAHPLSQSLLDQKFYPWSMVLFVSAAICYLTFLGLFTAIVMRTKHPQYYYDLTGYSFDSNLCQNVTAALGNTALKETADRVLRILMFTLVAILATKNVYSKLFLQYGAILAKILIFITRE